LLSQAPTPLNRAKGGVQFPGAVESTVMRALAKSPSERYPDVLVFAKTLEGVLASIGQPGTNDGLMSRVKGFFRSKG
jgi:hypothetical protein